MKRRDFIKKTATGVAAIGTAAAASTLATPAISKGKKQWTAVQHLEKPGFLAKR